MSAPAGYFVAPDANGEVWIWQDRVERPLPVLAERSLRNDPELWAYFTSDMPFRFEEPR